METVPFKRHRIADAEPAPAHQQCQSAQSGTGVLYWNKATASVAINFGGSYDPIELIAGEVIGGNRGSLDFAERQSGILGDVVAAEAVPKEADDAVLLLYPDDGTLGPRAAEGEQGVKIDLIEVFESLHPCPGEELFLKDSLELLDRVRLEPSAAGVGHVGIDGLLDRNSRLLPTGGLGAALRCGGRIHLRWGCGRSRRNRNGGCGRRLRLSRRGAKR
jgi:hypothetical protein